MSRVLSFVTKRQTGILNNSESKLDCDFILRKFACRKEECFKMSGDPYDVPPFACQFRKDRTSGDIDILAVASEEGEIILLNCNSSFGKNKVCGWHAHDNAIFDICWLPDCPKIISAGGDHSAILWDAATCNKITTFTGHSGSVKSIDVCPYQTSIFATGSRDGTVKVWDMRIPRCFNCYGVGKPEISIPNEAEHALSVKGHSRKKASSPHKLRSITSVAYQDLNHLASASSASPSVKIWDLRKTYSIKLNNPNPKCTLSYKGSTNSSHGSTSMTFDSTHKKLYVCCTDHCIYALDCHSQSSNFLAVYYGIKVQTFFVKVALSNDDQFLLSGSSDENGYLWKVSQPGLPIISLKGHSAEVTSVAWHPRKLTTLATCGDDNQVLIWKTVGENHNKNPEKFVGLASPILSVNSSSQNKCAKESDDSSPSPRTSLKERSLMHFFSYRNSFSSRKDFNYTDVLTKISPKKMKFDKEAPSLASNRSILTAKFPNNHNVMDSTASSSESSPSVLPSVSAHSSEGKENYKKKLFKKSSPLKKLTKKLKSSHSPENKRNKQGSIQGNLITCYFQDPTGVTK